MFYPTTLNKILKLIDRQMVSKMAEKHGADKRKNSFKTWDHLVSMISAQLTGAKSLRDVETIFKTQEHCLYHLNLKKVSHSTLGDANQNRDSGVFQDIANYLINLSKGKERCELQSIVSLIDSTPIPLRGRGHAWADATRTRKNSQGLKVHVQADGAAFLESVVVTNGNVNDVNMAQNLALEQGRVYIFDKGYCDYNWWKKIADLKSTFVTRCKKNTDYKVREERQIPSENKDDIVSDQVIYLPQKSIRGGKINQLAGQDLRLIKVPHPTKKAEFLHIVTNDLTAKAVQISNWYKQRWGIELLFKWLKQNLKLRRFMGENRNAIVIQILVAIITYVLLTLYAMLSQHKGRLKDLFTAVSTSLFTRPELLQKRRERQREKHLNSLQLNLVFS